MRKNICIGDLGLVVTGKTPPTSKKELYGDSSLFIKPTDISSDCKYTLSTEEGFSKLAEEKYSSIRIPKGATLVPCIGTIGTKMTMAHCDCYTNQSINSIIPNENYDSHYVYYLIKNFLPGLKQYNLGTASGREFVSKSNFEQIPIEVETDIKLQNRVASILSRYDDLIANYRQQIKLLEEAAQRIYKEWFVDMKFPNHENAVFGEDGLPEEWKKGKAIDFFNITIGKTPPRGEVACFVPKGKGVAWCSISDMNGMCIGDTKENLTQDSIDRYKVKVVPAGTVLLSFKLTVGRVAIAMQDMCTNEAIAHFYIEEDCKRSYLYQYLANFNYDSLGNTSSISKAVNSTIIKNMPMVLPTEELLQQFSAKVDTLLKQVEILFGKIDLLTEARDRILPRLMSGEIAV